MMHQISFYLLLGVAIVNSGLFIDRHWRLYWYTFEQAFLADAVYRWSNVLVPLLVMPIMLAINFRMLPHPWIPVVLYLTLVAVMFGKLFLNLIWLTSAANILGEVRSLIELLIHIYIWYVVWPMLT